MPLVVFEWCVSMARGSFPPSPVELLGARVGPMAPLGDVNSWSWGSRRGLRDPEGCQIEHSAAIFDNTSA